MLKRIGIWVLVFGLCSALFAGCAGMKYKKMYSDYEARVQQLKDMGGAEKAPYETAKAEHYLKIFKHEADENDTKGAELMKEKLDQYLEQGMMKVQ